jgi:molybdate transport system permease protein
MEWDAIRLSLVLAGWTLAILMPAGIVLARWLATARFSGRHWVEGLLALPLVLPPTVLGYYLLVAMGGTSSIGRWFQAATGTTLAFSFTGLVLASLLFNLPFAVQPIQRAIEAIDPDVREGGVLRMTSGRRCCASSCRSPGPASFGGRVTFALRWESSASS